MATHTRPYERDEALTREPTTIPGLSGMAWTFYYLAGNERVAMRMVEGSSDTLYYLFTDHLGSTGEVRSADGSLHSAQGYRAFGAVWYRMGSLPTGRNYTAQTEIEFGLLHYGARANDPSLARFVQADTIVPNPANPFDWDRYAYVRNSPIRYDDPSGHKSCELEQIQGTCGSIYGSVIAIENYIGKIFNNSGILALGQNWTLRQIATVYHATNTMIGGIDNITGGYGSQWVKKNLGGSSIVLGGADCNNLFHSSCVVQSTVHLLSDFDDKIKYNWSNSAIYGSLQNMIIHEFGHVWDNRIQNPKFGEATWIGNGPSDALINFIGGYSRALVRWWNDSLYLNDPLQDGFRNVNGFGYGNNSAADYFAHSFTAAIVAHDDMNAPQKAVMFVSALVSLTK